MASSSASTSSHHADTFDPRIAYPAATDAILDGLRANLNTHLDWLDGYLQQVKEADVLRVKSSNVPSSRSPGGLWVNILKSPARKRIAREAPSEHSEADYATQAPISSLSYASAQSKHKSIFHSNNDNAASLPKGSSSSGSLSRSPGKTGLKGIANISTYLEGDKENAPTSAPTSRSNISQYAANNNPLNRSNGTPKKNFLAATTSAPRSPGIRSPLQSSTSKAQRQAIAGPSSNLSASAPASPLRSPGAQIQGSNNKAYQSPLTRSQRLTQTTSSANASPSTATAASNIPSSAVSRPQRPVSPSPTPRPASRVLRSPTATQAEPRSQSNPASPRGGQARPLSPLSAVGKSKIATPRVASGSKNASASVASSHTTPVRVVDDVFMLPTANEPQGEEEENSKESEDMDDDEEEIENILLGYTKAPALEPGKKILKSEAVRSNAPPVSAVVPVVEIPIKEKELPAIPQQPLQQAAKATNATSGIKAAISRISPPRPTKSPARPVSTATHNVNNNKNEHANGGKGIIANISPSKFNRPLQNFRNNHSPVKRDMSHLASIASMLSPSKPEQAAKKEQTQSQSTTSRPASPQPKVTQSRVPVPQSATHDSPARPRSPVPAYGASRNGAAAAEEHLASPGSRPTSPSRISSRIAALAGAARSTASSRDNSPKAGLQSASPRFGLARSPRMQNTYRADSPSTSNNETRPQATASANAGSNGPVAGSTTSGIPTPTKMKRPMLSPIQSPNSQRSLALSSLRKAVPGFETNSFSPSAASPPASPRLPSTTSLSANIHHVIEPSTTHEAANAAIAKAAKTQRELESMEKEVQMQLEKDEELIHQHARAISALGKSFPPPPASPSRLPSVQAAKREKPAGLSPPAKSPLRKMNSKIALGTHQDKSTASPATTTQADQQKEAEVMPTPSKDANETVMPQTMKKKAENDTVVHSTAHKDSTVELQPSSPIFSTFLSNNNKRTSTLSFAGLPGRALGGAPGNGREKSIGLGLGLGKSLGASSMKERNASAAATQAEDMDSQGNHINGTMHNRQSFYTAALASQSRKRLSSTLGSVNAGPSSTFNPDSESQTSKASRTDFTNTARSSILASQMQQQPMSHSARFDLLRSRISNIKGTTGYVAPSASIRTSIAPSAQAPAIQQHGTSSVPIAKSDTVPTDKTESHPSSRPSTTLFSPATQATTAQTIPTSQTAKDIPTLSSSATSTFAATIASFVPAPSFGASFASIFGAGAIRPTKPDSPAKTTSSTAATQEQARNALYPSLPSMNNLVLPLASFTSPQQTAKKVRNEPEDDEMVEELVSPVYTENKMAPQSDSLSSPSAQQQKKRSSSVLSKVSNIEAKEAEARQERDRQASLSPRKASGSMPISASSAIAMYPAKAAAPRSTTPTFSPPRQNPVARLSTGSGEERRISSRPESRLSDMPAVPASDAPSLDLSIAGDVDIEDPGLEAIPRTFSDDTELPTTDATSQDEEDEEMDQADDEADGPVPTNARTSGQDRRVNPSDLLQQSAPASKMFKPAASTVSNLSKSTFKPSRPGKDTSEIQRPVHRPPSRAPSVSSLAPSRASTVSLASTSSYNPSRPGTSMSTVSKKGNVSVSGSTARPEIKSLANAAAAAKKEQAEKERKAAIKEERDQKRAAFLAAKREEYDSQSQQSSQGQNAGAAEKKRKEREDLNASQIVSSQGSTITKVKTVIKTAKTASGHSKVDEEHTKKRKMDAVEVVVHKPAVPKTTVPRPTQQKAPGPSQPSNYAKQTIASSSTSANAKALAASANSIGITKQAQVPNGIRPPPQASTSKMPLHPTKPTNPQALLSQHQQAILSASVAFGKSQAATSSKPSTSQAPMEPEMPEPEPFQLPEIDSEYSDSDEDVQAQKAALRPVWTHSPELRQALAVQAMFDPDQLFGEMPALRMEEIFKNPATAARLRHRTSSAHWSGPDAISRYEEKEYAKRMGFRRVQETDEAGQGEPSERHGK